MSFKSSAFKTHNEKQYGSVEKMYIHFYTIATGSDTQDIFWYCNDTENIELFSDIKHYTHTLKKYGHYTAYTGDIFVVKNIHKFKEILILLGAEEVDKSIWPLANDNTKEVHIWKVNNTTEFNELFDICFQNYEITNSFSSEPSLSKNRIELDEPTTLSNNYTIDETISGSLKNKDDQLIEVTFGNKTTFMKFYEFNQLPYKPIKSRLDNITLMTWFNTLVKKSEYQTACLTITKLVDFNNKENTNPQQDDDAIYEADGTDDITVLTEAESSKISHNDWIILFCNLYLEEDKSSDILLSDIYQMYVTASSWTNTATVSMATFIKRLRTLNKFTIKRRAKGMMVIGYTCLVGQQSEMFQQVRKGQLYKRQLLHYKSIIGINTIINKYRLEIQNIGHKYTREVFILLSDYQTLDYQTVAQFASIPQISTQLALYAEYIDSIIKVNSDIQNSLKDVRELGTKCTISDIQNSLEDFRELGTKCTIYFPFVLNNNNTCIKTGNSFIFDLANTTETDTIEPSAFNEHFGMFVSSKDYHLFEPEKNTPQDYNNAMGTPLNDNTTIKSESKDSNIWLRAIPSLI
jgi:hypothetical protein